MSKLEKSGWRDQGLEFVALIERFAVAIGGNNSPDETPWPATGLVVPDVCRKHVGHFVWRSGSKISFVGVAAIHGCCQGVVRRCL